MDPRRIICPEGELNAWSGQSGSLVCALRLGYPAQSPTVHKKMPEQQVIFRRTDQ
ncbi:hypothetical protein [Luoshenia tenuis]|uniref:hypothetical protein n=1 Tax=Luoshenia tenuis TaxID=2763654 RepID=UPI003D8CC258